MTIEVIASTDPVRVLAEAEEFLAAKPVHHNLILTLLHNRVAHHEPGRYWIAMDDGQVVGVVFQSPFSFPATLTPMQPDVTVAMAETISDAGIDLRGVSGEAATTALFAGQWTERHKSAAVPIQGQRIYEMIDRQKIATVSWRFRQADMDDRDLVITWMRDFGMGSGEIERDPTPIVDRRLPAGRFWLWEDGEPVSMAARSKPVANVVRVQAVYTPPERRNHGYASACVGALSQQILNDGLRSILYTDLGNPTSNAIYRRIGYRAVAEGLRYRFV